MEIKVIDSNYLLGYLHILIEVVESVEDEGYDRDDRDKREH